MMMMMMMIYIRIYFSSYFACNMHIYIFTKQDLTGICGEMEPGKVLNYSSKRGRPVRHANRHLKFFHLFIFSPPRIEHCPLVPVGNKHISPTNYYMYYRKKRGKQCILRKRLADRLSDKWCMAIFGRTRTHQGIPLLPWEKYLNTWKYRSKVYSLINVFVHNTTHHNRVARA